MLDKTKVIKRLIYNRKRFGLKSDYFQRLHRRCVVVHLDIDCLCGLEDGDKFECGDKVIQVVVMPSLGQAIAVVSKVK